MDDLTSAKSEEIRLTLYSDIILLKNTAAINTYNILIKNKTMNNGAIKDINVKC